MTEAELLTSVDPIKLFERWYAEIQEAPGIREPTAMTLATADAEGQPSLRTVLLKQFIPADGFVFYTNYHSHKGADLAANPKAALLFYWDPLFQQIKIEGSVSKISRHDSEAYWHSRPFESKLAGWLSHQSQPVVGSLVAAYEKAEHEWHGRDIPCPENWGGYILKPQVMEFWIGQKHRLHTSMRFQRDGSTWSRQQLYP